ncbi:hypothetical protein M8C21_002442, partial [Ambrosia artemisiifolia]
ICEATNQRLIGGPTDTDVRNATKTVLSRLVVRMLKRKKKSIGTGLSKFVKLSNLNHLMDG